MLLANKCEAAIELALSVTQSVVAALAIVVKLLYGYFCVGCYLKQGRGAMIGGVRFLLLL